MTTTTSPQAALTSVIEPHTRRWLDELAMLNPITGIPAPRAAITQAASYLRNALTSNHDPRER